METWAEWLKKYNAEYDALTNEQQIEYLKKFIEKDANHFEREKILVQIKNKEKLLKNKH
jgi:hypothetical protein